MSGEKQDLWAGPASCQSGCGGFKTVATSALKNTASPLAREEESTVSMWRVVCHAALRSCGGLPLLTRISLHMLISVFMTHQVTPTLLNLCCRLTVSITHFKPVKIHQPVLTTTGNPPCENINHIFKGKQMYSTSVLYQHIMLTCLL